MAKLVIERYEEKVLFPETPIRHYRIYVSLVTSDSVKHSTYCDVSRDTPTSPFNFTCFEDADIDEFDYRNKWAMSEQVMKWAERNIK